MSDGEYLYHGTTAAHARRILHDGLKPRQETGESNWAYRDLESAPGYVYLTSVFGPYYGLKNRPDDDSRFAIVEVDQPDEPDLYPDEDYIEWALRGGDIEKPDGLELPPGPVEFEERTRRIRDELEMFKPHWQRSLTTKGTCAKRGAVPTENVRRVSFVDPIPELVAELNARDIGLFVGDGRADHELLTARLFGEDVDPDEYVKRVYGHRSTIAPEMRRRARRAVTADCFDVVRNDDHKQ